MMLLEFSNSNAFGRTVISNVEFYTQHNAWSSLRVDWDIVDMQGHKTYLPCTFLRKHLEDVLHQNKKINQ